MVFVGASEPQHMSYMVRLGLWGEGTEFDNFQKFQEAIEQRYYFFLFYGKESRTKNIDQSYVFNN